MDFNGGSDRMEAETHSRLQSGAWIPIGSDGHSHLHLEDIFTHGFCTTCPLPTPMPGSGLSLEILSALPPPSAVALAATLETASFKRISTPEEVEKEACSTSHF